jgi:myo-inositol-1(or 4)-monophosphatase
VTAPGGGNAEGTAPLADDHALLCEAVREGGAVALGYFQAGFEVREKTPGDPVTDADLAVDALLRERLAGPRPGYGWMSEESADSRARLDAPRTWVVDPIDGTKGFVSGSDEWVISAALVESGRPVAAAIFNPLREEFYDAANGGGTRLDGRPVRVTRAASLHGLRLGSSRNEQRRNLWQHLFADARIEVVDAIAYKLALVACRSPTSSRSSPAARSTG